MDEALKITMLSPVQTIYEGCAEAVFLPGSLCPFEVLRGHAPIISSLEKGKVRVRHQDGAEEAFPVDGGFVRVANDNVTICVE